MVTTFEGIGDIGVFAWYLPRLWIRNGFLAGGSAAVLAGCPEGASPSDLQ